MKWVLNNIYSLFIIIRERKLICFFSLIIIIIPFSSCFFRDENSIVSNLLLSITAVLILFYTYETYKLRYQVIKQYNLSILPIIILKHDSKNKKVYLENIGNSVAKNVKIVNFESKFEEFENHRKPMIHDCGKIFPIPYLFPNKKEEIQFNRYSSEVIYQEFFETALALGTKDITIQYQNFEGITYETNVIMENLNISDTQFRCINQKVSG